jgi:hypothetical protein
MLFHIVTPVLFFLSCAAVCQAEAFAAPPAKTTASASPQILEIEISDAGAGAAKPSKATLTVALDGGVKGYIDSGDNLRRCEVSTRAVADAIRLHLECASASGRAEPPRDLVVSAERSFTKGRRVVVARLVGADGRKTEVAVTAR